MPVTCAVSKEMSEQNVAPDWDGCPEEVGHHGVVPAAIVLYQPDLLLLDLLLTALDRNHRRLFLYVNGSIDQAVVTRLDALPNARVIRNGENVGQGMGLNTVAAAALAEGFKYLQLFDQDSTPDSDLPSALMARFMSLQIRFPHLAVVGPFFTTPQGEHFCTNRYSWRDRAQGTVDFAPTSGLIVSLEAWREIGPFRADYFIGGIDVEWGLRAWDRGFASVIAADIAMVQRWGTPASVGEQWKPQILRQSNARNYFYIRNAVDILRLGYVPLSWRIRFAARLFVQIGVLLLTRDEAGSKKQALMLALSDGWHGRLGLLPRKLQYLD